MIEKCFEKMVKNFGTTIFVHQKKSPYIFTNTQFYVYGVYYVSL